jgi:hypothetical protein
MVIRGMLKLRLPLNKLMSSKPLRAYEPAGAPGAIPDGVRPSVTLVCALSDEASSPIVNATLNNAANQRSD